MLDPSTILLDMDYIFADVTTCETELVCLPIMNLQHENQDLTMFFKNILFTTQFDQTENCDHVAKIINYLNSSPVFSIVDFKNLLESISGTSAPAQVQQSVVQNSQVQQTQSPSQQPVQQSVQQKAPVKQPIQPKQVVQTPINQPKVQTPPAQQPTQQGKPEKKISMFDLMMHYSKENAALYKQQKAAQKATQAQPVATPVPQAKKQPAQTTGFAIPGQAVQPAKPGFAVPGQQQPPDK